MNMNKRLLVICLASVFLVNACGQSENEPRIIKEDDIRANSVETLTESTEGNSIEEPDETETADPVDGADILCGTWDVEKVYYNNTTVSVQDYPGTI